jgi:hypothetical protein
VKKVSPMLAKIKFGKYEKLKMPLGENWGYRTELKWYQNAKMINEI